MATSHSPCDTPIVSVKSGNWSRFSNFISSDKAIRWLEIFTLIAFVLFAWATISIFLAQDENSQPLSPAFAATLLVANLLPASMLIALLGRRIALKRTQSQIAESNGKLHVRLVGIFSVITTIPVILLVIFASLLVQNGVQFWFSDQARGMLENAESLATGYYQEKLNDVGEETSTMATDIRFFLNRSRADNPQFLDAYLTQVLNRKLSESAIVTIDKNGTQRTTAVVASDNQEREMWISKSMLDKLGKDEGLVVEAKPDRIEAATILFDNPRLYFCLLYTSPSPRDRG